MADDSIRMNKLCVIVWDARKPLPHYRHALLSDDELGECIVLAGPHLPDFESLMILGESCMHDCHLNSSTHHCEYSFKKFLHVSSCEIH